MNVIMNYYRHIDRSKVQFDFLCFSTCSQSYEAEIEQLGGQVFYITKPGSSLKALSELREFFENKAKYYSAIHNHEVYMSFYLRPLAKRTGIPRFIVHSHATRYSDRLSSSVRNAALCVPLRFIQCEKLACSKDAGDFLYGKGHNHSYHVLHNAIDTNRYRFDIFERNRIRKKFKLENSFVIGHVGRYMPQKNHKFLVNVFANVLNEIPSAKLMLIGDGPWKANIKKQCKELGIADQVLFIDATKAIWKWYSAMDILVLPSIFEGLGNSLIEAQANGLKCLASDCVPMEAKIRNEFEFLPLKNKLWERAILAYQKANIERDVQEQEKVYELFCASHYDINIESQWLQTYYENTNSDVHI